MKIKKKKCYKCIFVAFFKVISLFSWITVGLRHTSEFCVICKDEIKKKKENTAKKKEQKSFHLVFFLNRLFFNQSVVLCTLKALYVCQSSPFVLFPLPPFLFVFTFIDWSLDIFRGSVTTSRETGSRLDHMGVCTGRCGSWLCRWTATSWATRGPLSSWSQNGVI